MVADLNQIPSPILPATSPVATVTVATRLFYRQRALSYWLGSVFVTGALLCVGVTRLRWLPINLVVGVAVVLLWSVPFAIGYLCRHAYLKPAHLSFTAQGVYLEASDTQVQVAWGDLATYQVEFSLNKLVGEGYRLKLREAQGHSVTVNLLERNLLLPESGLRPDSALAYLSRYIGWHDRQVAADEGEQIVYRPGLLTRKMGTVLFTILGILLLVDLWLRWKHPTAKGTSVSVLGVALVTGLQALGQKKQGDRYARYLGELEATGISAADVAP
jgi:hypothetical protein